MQKPINPNNEFSPLVNVIISGIREKKGRDIAVVELINIDGSVADFFVICTVSSNTQAEAVGRSVEDEVRKVLNEKPWHIEGTQNGEWVLVDYVNVAVHIFQQEFRKFYDLEELWGDADIKYLPDEPDNI